MCRIQLALVALNSAQPNPVLKRSKGRYLIDSDMSLQQALRQLCDSIATRQADRQADAPSLPYPIADPGQWYGEGTYEADGGRMVGISPQAYIAAVRPLDIDEVSREGIDILKEHILAGKTLDPLLIRANGKEDGRHRAHAAIELGIQVVPVIAYGEQFRDAPKYQINLMNQTKDREVNMHTDEAASPAKEDFPTEADFDGQDPEISGNEMSAELTIVSKDGRYKLSATLASKNPDSSDDELRRDATLHMELEDRSFTPSRVYISSSDYECGDPRDELDGIPLGVILEYAENVKLKDAPSVQAERMRS